jgi:hypothetical protein
MEEETEEEPTLADQIGLQSGATIPDTEATSTDQFHAARKIKASHLRPDS